MCRWLVAMDDRRILQETRSSKQQQTQRNIDDRVNARNQWLTQTCGAALIISNGFRCRRQSKRTSMFLSLHVKRRARNRACSRG
jgi:hypothetical protein